MNRLVSSFQNSKPGAVLEDALGLAAICVLVISALALPGLS